MDKSETIINKHFYNIEKTLGPEVEKKYPLIVQEFSRLKIESLKLLDEIDKSNVFQVFKELLCIDAYLQILRSYMELNDEFYSQNEILEHSFSDMSVYYKEAFGYRLNDDSPDILLFKILEEYSCI